MIVLAVLMLLATYIGFRFGLRKLVSTFTSTNGVQIGFVDLPASQASNVVTRIRSFDQVLRERTASEPLHLTGQELTWWLNQQPDFALHKGTFVVKPMSNLVGIAMSLPLDFINTPLLKGRYFNGEAKFSVTVTNRQLYVHMQSLEANGKPLPQSVTGRLDAQNFSESAQSNEVWRTFMKLIDHVDLRDNEVIFHPRQAPK